MDTETRFQPSRAFTFPHWSYCFEARDRDVEGYTDAIIWCRNNFGPSEDIERRNHEVVNPDWSYNFVNRAVMIQSDLFAAAFKVRWC